MYLWIQYLRIKNILFQSKISEGSKELIAMDGPPEFRESIYQIKNSFNFLLSCDNFMELKKALFYVKTYNKVICLINSYHLSQKINHANLIRKIVNIHLKNLSKLAKLSYQPLTPMFRENLVKEAFECTQIFHKLAKEFHELLINLKIKDDKNVLVNEESICQLQKIVTIFETGIFDDSSEHEWKNSLKIFIFIAKRLFTKTTNPILTKMITKDKVRNDKSLFTEYPLYSELFNDIDNLNGMNETRNINVTTMNENMDTDLPLIEEQDLLNNLPDIETQELESIFNCDDFDSAFLADIK